MEADKSQGSMAWHAKLAYGVGHFINDLFSSMWFTYFLIYFEQVLGFTGVEAGTILLIGQIADGLAVPVVGVLCDIKFNNGFIAKYGRRKIWHLGGSLLMAVLHPFLWLDAIDRNEASAGERMAYYCIITILSQFGAAATQISHLALIPDLTTKKKQRTELTSLRYAAAVIGNLSVYFIIYFVLDNDCDTINDQVGIGYGNFTTNFTTTLTGTTKDDCAELGPEDSSKFMTVSYICLSVGLVFTTLFQLGVREKPYSIVKAMDSVKNTDVHSVESTPTDLNSKSCKQENQSNLSSSTNIPSATKYNKDSIKKAMKKTDWFKELSFYQVAVLYMASRLYVILSQSYIVLYIQDTLKLPVNTVATVPFVMYASGFAGSMVMKYVNSKIGRKATFTLGCLVGLTGCIWVGIDRSPEFEEWGIYLVTSLLGIGGSTMLITSLSITADLIGDNVEGSAFVYGFMGLVDKVTIGSSVMIIQIIGDKQEPGSPFYQMVITYACGASCVLGILVISTLINRRINSRNNYIRRKSTLVISTFDDDHDQQGDDSEGGITNKAFSGDIENQDVNKSYTNNKNNKSIPVATSEVKDFSTINCTSANFIPDTYLCGAF